MRDLAGAIVVFAGSILIAVGVVVDATTGSGATGIVFGTIVGLGGFAVLFGGTLRRLWDAIPTDDKRSGSGGAARSPVEANGFRNDEKWDGR